MKKVDVIKTMRAVLGEALTPRGFVWKRKHESFLRRHDDGLDEVAVPVWAYSPRYEIELLIGIRHDVVADVVNRFAGINPDYQATMMTSTTRLGWFLPGHDRFAFSTSHELERWLEMVVGDLLPNVLEHFEAYADGPAMLDAFATQKNGVAFDNTAQPIHGMHAIVLAQQNDPARLDSEIAAASGAMAQFLPIVRQPFDDLVAALRRSS